MIALCFEWGGSNFEGELKSKYFQGKKPKVFPTSILQFCCFSYSGHLGDDLCQSAETGDVKTVEHILLLGLSPNTRDHRSNLTPLHHSASHNNTNLAKLLLKHNAGTEARDDEDQTPLHTAAYFNNVEMEKLLIEYNAKIEARDEDEQTPLHTATYNGSMEVLRLLLEKKADTTARGLDKETPLHTAVSCNNTEAAELLLSYKADIEAEDKNNQTPLHNAAKYSKKAMVQLLLKHKADIKARDKDNKTPLQLARASPTTFCREDNGAVQHLLMEYKESTNNI